MKVLKEVAGHLVAMFKHANIANKTCPFRFTFPSGCSFSSLTSSSSEAPASNGSFAGDS